MRVLCSNFGGGKNGLNFIYSDICRIGYVRSWALLQSLVRAVKRSKTDAADAEAICEAVTRPTMRFVPVKTPEEQAAGVVLKTRELFVRQRSQTANAMRAHMAEFGITSPLPA